MRPIPAEPTVAAMAGARALAAASGSAAAPAEKARKTRATAAADVAAETGQLAPRARTGRAAPTTEIAGASTNIPTWLIAVGSGADPPKEMGLILPYARENRNTNPDTTKRARAPRPAAAANVPL